MRTARCGKVDDPHERIEHEPLACGGCGERLTAAPMAGVAVRQVFELPDIGARVIERRVVPVPVPVRIERAAAGA